MDGVTGAVFGQFGEWLDQIPSWVFAVFATALILGVGAADYVTGYEVDLSIFYLGPVVLATWFASEWVGLILSLFAALMWTVSDPGTAYANALIPFWNSIVRISFFLVTVFLVALAKRAISAERAASRTDALTGVANGRAFDDRAQLALAEMRRSGLPITFAYIDLDHFKNVNDTLGHREGDRLLMVLADAMASRLRTTDLVARLGGDEFGVLLPDTGVEEAERVLADLRLAIDDALSPHWPVGITAGAVTFTQPPSSVDQMVNLADEVMYEGKRAGRGRVDHQIWPPARGSVAPTAELGAAQ